MDDTKKKKTEEVEHDRNQGEGDKSADRAYRRVLRENDPAKLGREAMSDVERDPGRYEEAEIEGKRRSAGDLETDKDVI